MFIENRVHKNVLEYNNTNVFSNIPLKNTGIQKKSSRKILNLSFSHTSMMDLWNAINMKWLMYDKNIYD